MITIEQHIANNRAAIEKEAREYAKSYGVDLEKARRDVEDEYKQGWYEAVDALEWREACDDMKRREGYWEDAGCRA